MTCMIVHVVTQVPSSRFAVWRVGRDMCVVRATAHGYDALGQLVVACGGDWKHVHLGDGFPAWGCAGQSGAERRSKGPESKEGVIKWLKPLARIGRRSGESQTAGNDVSFSNEAKQGVDFEGTDRRAGGGDGAADYRGFARAAWGG